MKSYPKRTSFTAAAGPAFPTAAAAQVATQDVYWREESRPDPVEQSDSDEELEFLLFESDDETGKKITGGTPN